ncbi:transposase [Polaromonas sp. P1(28)-8]|nr:transposase [Polaromonas sp. P1(28)-8]
MLCMADRGFRGYEHWKAASETGAQLLWRCASNRQLPVVKPLADGSYLSVIYPDVKSRRTRSGEIAVRVIEYSLPGVADAQERYRLLTTLLSPEQAPALELARLYHERWEVEAVFDELKTHLAQRRRTLRSKTPDGVRQEFYGWVLAHYAVCWLMHHAASERRLEQRRLSFTGHVHLLRRAQPRSGAFPQGAQDCESAGSMTCCTKLPRCVAPAVAGEPIRAWLKDETRLMPAMTRSDCQEHAQRPRRTCSNPSHFRQAKDSRHSLKRTVLGPDPQSMDPGSSPG